ncbi:MAG TPA: hypothetical protein PKJ08_10600, partial [Candidatus Cloacimonadota bacterium]|nr:hypothetical protein [Candidatus Cloacimonadota bacterium]
GDYIGYQLPLMERTGNLEQIALRLPYYPADSVFVITDPDVASLYEQKYLFLFAQKLLQEITKAENFSKGLWQNPDIIIRSSQKSQLNKADILFYFQQMDASYAFEFKAEDSHYLEMIISHLNDRLNIRMPKDREFLTGMDKKVIERYYLNLLSIETPKSENQPDYLTWQRKALTHSDIPGLTVYEDKPYQDQFFKKVFMLADTDTMRFVYDMALPEESLYNLIFTELSKEKIRLNIQFLLYNDNSRFRQMTLAQFLNRMNAFSDCYLGVEKCNDTEIEFSLLFDDRDIDQVHLLYLTIPVESLFSKIAEWKGKMLLTIPKDENISIRQYEKEKKGRFKVQR